MDVFTKENIEQALSTDRLGTYLNMSEGSFEKAIGLYRANVKLSETLYTPLHILEVTLRNRMHFVMSEYDNEHWFNYCDDENQRKKVLIAIKSLKKKHKKISPSYIVAELSFGFWTEMLGKKYDHFWCECLHKITILPQKRQVIAERIGIIRTLRNRIAHHEPILEWKSKGSYHDYENIKAAHNDIIELIESMSPDMASLALELSSFNAEWEKFISNGLLDNKC